MKLNYESAFKEVQSLLKDNANEAQAHAMSKYMRNQFTFYGIKSPLRKELVREIKAVVKPTEVEEYQYFIQLLWYDSHRECQYIATDLMGTIVKKMDVEWIDFLEQLILTKSWWDTVDFLAPNLLGNIFYRNISIGHRYTDKWIESDNFWLQRAALIYQLRYKDEVDFERLTRYILRRKNSNEFFVQKAAGWALRNYSKYNSKAVRLFLSENSDLSKLTLREGSKYL
jgi:3-methyladenine DNA glycosylase AlkD